MKNTGNWSTLKTFYNNRELIIKRKQGEGVKLYSIYNNNIEFTLRYYFVSVYDVIEEAKKKIDKLKNI